MAKTRKEQFLYPHDLIEELDSRLHFLFKHGFLGGRGDSTVEIDKTSDEHIDELIEWICKEHLLKYKEIYEPNWIKCEVVNGSFPKNYDNFPKDGTWNIWCNSKGEVWVARVKEDCYGWKFYPTCDHELEEVIAWMPYPKPYIESEERA